jgi:hypothetical protein
VPAADELRTMAARLPPLAKAAADAWVDGAPAAPDYVDLVDSHNPRRRKSHG